MGDGRENRRNIQTLRGQREMGGLVLRSSSRPFHFFGPSESLSEMKEIQEVIFRSFLTEVRSLWLEFL